MSDQIEMQASKRFLEVKRAYEEALLRKVAYDALPWWKKAVWLVFRR